MCCCGGLLNVNPHDNVTTSNTLSTSSSISKAEVAAIVILLILALLSLTANITVLLLYCRKPTLMKNAGNMFTVSLIVIDVIFSGAGIPSAIALKFLKNATPQVLTRICLCTKSMHAFCAMVSAASTALLALDRGDVSLRPSRRFFTGKRPAIAIALAWLLSTIAFLPIVLTLHNAYVSSKSSDFQLAVRLKSNTSIIISNVSDDRSILSLHNICDIYVTYQTTVFLLSGSVIFAIYLKILKSVQKRNIRHAKKSISGMQRPHASTVPTKTSRFVRRFVCCRTSQLESETIAMNRSHNKQIPLLPCKQVPSKIIQHESITNRSEYIQDEKTSPAKFTLADNKKTMDVQSCDNDKGKEFDSSSINNDFKSRTNTNGKSSKTDFASVALSVTVVLTLKRVMAAKIKQKQKKIRHLRRMTCVIILTFVICWTPFYVYPILLVASSKGECYWYLYFAPSKSKEAMIRENHFRLKNIVFLWTLALASVSSVLNPFIYSLSREKIRNDFRKLFCWHRANERRLGGCRNMSKRSATNRKRQNYSAIWSTKWGKNRFTTALTHPSEPALTREEKTIKKHEKGDSNWNNSTPDLKQKLLNSSSLQIVQCKNTQFLSSSCASLPTNQGSISDGEKVV
ncbi:uncharacterized protein LOC143448943 [Clavelina lepadiformis]|uniref:uncharacterized protein LOC143448943 n=1 Tax=Clavelina lepadiformis TaxID=159417 RepID=UPI004041B6AB